MPVLGLQLLDDIVTQFRVLRSRGVIPAAHLLRRTFEEAADFAAAVAMLADETIAVAMPALFTVAGVEAEEFCIVEAWGRERRVHRAGSGGPPVLGVANQWLSPGLRGRARNRAVTSGAPTTPEENNAVRRATICRLQAGDFRGAADLPEPVINSDTVMVVVANARRGEMVVEALDPPAGRIMPRVVARRRVREESTRRYARGRLSTSNHSRGGPDGHSVDNSARDDRGRVGICIIDLKSTNGSLCRGVRRDARSDAQYRPGGDGAIFSQDSRSEAARRLCPKHAHQHERLARRDAGDGRRAAGAALPLPGERMEAYSIGPEIGNVRNDNAGLIERLKLA
jgi:hypothetical protein